MTTIAAPLPVSVQAKPRVPRSVFIALALGILAGASAGISTRYALAEGMSPLAIAFFRLVLAWMLLTPIVLSRYMDDLRRLTRRDLLWGTIAGVIMALHFVLWSASLAFASVMVATVIVCSSPIWAAVFEVTFLKEKLTRLILIGLMLAVIGNIIIALASSASGGTNQIIGGFLAMIAAIAIAVQRTIGRDLRRRLPIFPFLWFVYGCGALFLTLIMFVTGTPVIGYSPRGYFWVFMLTLLPQLMGHGSFNYALGYFSATITSLIVQLQPPISTVIAFLVFHEVPGVLQLVGAVVIISGVVMAVRGRQIESASHDETTITPQQIVSSSPR
ncbi:MAG: DMT family transporter [Chloroflexota bacterium]|nr:DMT family transporter [Chloroflexota bacterium]